MCVCVSVYEDVCVCVCVYEDVCVYGTCMGMLFFSMLASTAGG